MELNPTTIVLAIVVLFILYKALCDQSEDFNVKEDIIPNYFHEDKFGPKEHVYIHQKPCMSDNMKRHRECHILNNSVYARNMGDWKHDSHLEIHGPRNTGFAPAYHNMKHHQFTPSIPNVSNDYGSISEIPAGALVNEKDYPTLEVPENFQQDPYIN